jgi:hypothetical protein
MTPTNTPPGQFGSPQQLPPVPPYQPGLQTPGPLVGPQQAQGGAAQQAQGGNSDWLRQAVGGIMGGLQQGGVQAQNFMNQLKQVLGGSGTPQSPSLPQFDYLHRAAQGPVTGGGLAPAPERAVFQNPSYLQGQVDAYMQQQQQGKKKGKK